MTDEQKPTTFRAISVGVLAGATIGLMLFAVIVAAVLSIGGLQCGIVPRWMWQTIGVLTAMSIVAALVLSIVGEAPQEIRPALLIAMLTTFIVQIGLVDLVAYEIAPRFLEATEIKAEVE